MIEIQKVKDDVALKNGFNKWQGVIQNLREGLISYQELEKLENEVISEVAKQVAERQKQNCKDFIFGNMIYPEYRETVYNGILNATIPEIK